MNDTTPMTAEHLRDAVDLQIAEMVLAVKTNGGTITCRRLSQMTVEDALRLFTPSGLRMRLQLR